MIDEYIFRFLSYYPLKQGLKRTFRCDIANYWNLFLSYYPLKQGLKRLLGLDNNRQNKDFYPTIH